MTYHLGVHLSKSWTLKVGMCFFFPLGVFGSRAYRCLYLEYEIIYLVICDVIFFSILLIFDIRYRL